MAENSTENQTERSWPFRTRHLIGGVALYSPNLDPSAIPIPEYINFLYNLPQRPLCALAEDDRNCLICGDRFVTDLPEGDEDVFHELPGEVPLVMSHCCNMVVGSCCLERWLDPFAGHNDSLTCPFCRHACFTKLESWETAEGEKQLRRILDWHRQEMRRRITDGPEEWKEEAIKELGELERGIRGLGIYIGALRAERVQEDRRLAERLESNEGMQVMLDPLYNALADLQRDIEVFEDDLLQRVQQVEAGLNIVARVSATAHQSEVEGLQLANEERETRIEGDTLAQQFANWQRTMQQYRPAEIEGLQPSSEVEENSGDRDIMAQRFTIRQSTMHEHRLAEAERPQPSNEERAIRTENGIIDDLRQAAIWLRNRAIRLMEEPQNVPVGEVEEVSEEAGNNTNA